MIQCTDANTCSADPPGYLFAYLSKVLPGPLCQWATGPSLDSRIMTASTISGQNCATIFVNRNLSTPQTIPFSPLGLAGTTMTRMEQSPAYPYCATSTVSLSDMAALSVPAAGVVVLSGTHV